MKYLKTYEGLFSSEEPKIPQSFIDKVIKTIKDGGYPNTKIIPYSPSVIIRSETPIGGMLVVIQLIFDKHASHKLIKTITKGSDRYYSININVFPEDDKINNIRGYRRTLMIGGARTYNVDLKDISKIQFGLITNSIDDLVDQIDQLNKEKKDRNDFYNDFTQEELIDLVSDLADILGSSPKVEKYSSYGKGYSVRFTTSRTQIHSSRHDDKDERRFRSSDVLSQAVVELNSLDKRLKDGYGLEMEFSLHNNFIHIEIWKEEETTNNNLPIPEPQHRVRF